jgi:hypothetical protein
MILPGLFPAQVRSRPTVRGGATVDNARVDSTTMEISKSLIPASLGDMVVFDSYIEGGSFGSNQSSNFGLVFPASGPALRGYKLWDGTEPSTLQIRSTDSSLSIGCYSIYVVTGVTKLVEFDTDGSSSSSVLTIAQPARFWITTSTSTGGSTQTSTPPSGYTGYQQATTLAADDGGIRTAYRIADEATQLGGSWSNLPAQNNRRSWAFR